MQELSSVKQNPLLARPAASYPHGLIIFASREEAGISQMGTNSAPWENSVLGTLFS